MLYKKGTFIVVPNRDILMGEDPFTQSIFLWICSHANEDGECFPSIPTLSKEAGCGETSVKVAIKRLEELKIIEKVIRKDEGRNLSNIYQICIVGRHTTQGGSPHDPGVGRHTPANYNHITKPNELVDSFVAKPTKESGAFQTDEEWTSVSEGEEDRVDSRRKDKEVIFKLFSKTMQPWWKYRQEKESALRLFDSDKGIDQITKAVEFAKKYMDDPYCPKIRTPRQLEEKWEKLLDFKESIGL